MKNINKIIVLSVVGIASALNGCKEPFDMTPVPNTTPSNLTANVVFANASPDAPSLDFYVNNLKIGESLTAGVAQVSYTSVPIAANGGFTNTNIRAKATTGTIGGVLNKSDVVFRSTNNGTGNFQASNGGNYTIILLDTINRPVPLRTADELGLGNITYYSTQPSFVGHLGGADTTFVLTGNNSTKTYNLVKKWNNNVPGPFFYPIGLVPLGSSDVGGLRFLLLTDALVAPAAGKAAVRFVNASPDIEVVTSVTVNAVPLAGSFSYPLTAANFNPTVGSRSATIAFSNLITAGNSYTIEVKTSKTDAVLAGYDFADGGNYTIIYSGDDAKGHAITVIKNK